MNEVRIQNHLLFCRPDGTETSCCDVAGQGHWVGGDFWDFGDESNGREVRRASCISRSVIVEILNQKLAALVHAPMGSTK